MRKVFISLIIILVMASQALAGIKVDLPSGWTREDSGNTIIIKSRNSNASVAAAFNLLGESDFTDIVERLYIQMRGKDLEQDDDGDYTFNFTNRAGVSSMAMIMKLKSGSYYLVVSFSGFENDKSIQGDMEKILNSIEYESE